MTRLSPRIAAAGAVCAVVAGTLAGAAPVRVAASVAPGSAITIGGTIAAIVNNGPAETLTVARAGREPYSVTLASTTTVTIRGGAPTTFSSLLQGDRVVVRGTATVPATRSTPGTMTATTIADASLVARANIVGQVQSTPSATQVIIVAGHRTDRGFVPTGRVVTVDVTASTPISLPAGTTGAAGLSAVVPGAVVRVSGIYDDASSVVVSTTMLVVLPALQPECDAYLGCIRDDTMLQGRLLSAPITTTAPVSLSLRLSGGAVISVTVAPTTTILRRYDGASSLSQLVKGDVLQVKGTFEAAPSRVFDATRVEDVSEQDAFTSAVVRLLLFSYDPTTNSALARGRILADVRHAPYARGEIIRLQFSAATGVFYNNGTPATLAQLSTIGYASVSGRYDRHAHLLFVQRVQI